MDRHSQDGFTTLGDALYHWENIKPLLPKGVCFKQNNRLYFKFKLPWTGRYTTLRSGCDFSINGINDYLQKARLLKLKLNEIKKTGITSSEFEQWYSVNIFSEVKSTDDKLTFRAILKIIEDEYYQGKHKFTGEKRSRDDVSCIRSFNNAYGFYFEKIDNLDDYPTIENCLNYLNNFKDDSKSKYEALGKIKKIISYCSDNTQKLILPKLSKIKLEKPKASNGKAIDFEQFWNWLSEQYQIIDSLETHKATERLSWLWVYKMCVAFGLRPSEIMSAINPHGVTTPSKTLAVGDVAKLR